MSDESLSKAQLWGVKRGPFWWNYNLSAGSRFIDALPRGYELRWYGITVFDIGIGVMIRVRKERS